MFRPALAQIQGSGYQWKERWLVMLQTCSYNAECICRLKYVLKCLKAGK